eukprot:TRINITY_DN106187_c0_g1_i1.p1 TRINITY_DN106187_c0_g1~~TRINITY_DN106187_c0_g1_i1.p1  ORF type:complete len:368 (-),score=51.09 TRINITY_DN106187_c0_g1_i1:157-1260(-)
MPPRRDAFVDHYEVLGCSPATSIADLKRAYHQKLREFHPDKRQTSLHGFGHQMTEKLNAAWEILSSPDKKEAYDNLWYSHQQNQPRPSSQPSSQSQPQASPRPQPQQRRWQRASSYDSPRHDRASMAERCRHEGNDLYKAAQAASNSGDADTAVELFTAAISKYTTGISFAKKDPRLYSNRALCHGALKQWRQCREDACRVTQLDPCFMKGWFMRAKSYWKEGQPLIALQVLDSAQKLLPSDEDLAKLRSEIEKEHKKAGAASRNPSPCPSEGDTSSPRFKFPARPPRCPSPPFARPAEDAGPFADIVRDAVRRARAERPPRPASQPPEFGWQRPRSQTPRQPSPGPPLRPFRLGSPERRRQVDAAL